MARYLVDANVLSEPTKRFPSKAVVEWVGQHESGFAVNPIILGELRYGMLILPAGRRRKRLETWFAQATGFLQVLQLDRETGDIWAVLLADLKKKGRAMPVKDSLIAATALQHGLTIATRNTNDYRHTGARLVNPFEPNLSEP